MKKCCDLSLQIILCSKQFCMITFLCISYDLTGKRNLDINFFQVLTYCNFSNISLIEKCYQDNQQRFMSTIRKQYWNFLFFHTGFLKNTKNAPILTIFVGCGWLMNLSLLIGSDKVCQSSIQSDNFILSGVIEYTTNYQYYYIRQTDTFVKTVFSDSGISKRKDLMKISKVIFHIKLIPSH